MKFRRRCGAKFNLPGLLDGVLQGFEDARCFESRESEMWRKCALITRDAQRRARSFYRAGKFGEFRPGVNSGPEHAWAVLIWEKSPAATSYGSRGAGSKFGQR